jgi:hypothetical protein
VSHADHDSAELLVLLLESSWDSKGDMRIRFPVGAKIALPIAWAIVELAQRPVSRHHADRARGGRSSLKAKVDFQDGSSDAWRDQDSLRTGWDSNPRYAINVHTLSRRAP